MKFTLLAVIVTLTLMCSVWLSMPPLAADGRSERRTERPARHRDVSYGPHKKHRLDIYVPRSSGPFPVMIFVHGGAWQIGDKRAVGKKPEYFSRRGWILVSVNYRLLPDGRHPANVSDVASAVAWVHDHIADYQGDPTSLFLMGHSAGAHLASLVATDGRYLQNAEKSLNILRGVISLDTQAYDIPKLMDRPASSTTYRRVFSDDPDTWKDASPITHVAPDTGIPPFLIFYTRGMRRTANPQRRVQAEAFAAALQKAGIPADVVDASDRNHGEINRRLGDPRDRRVTGAVEQFLNALQAAASETASADTR